MKKQFNVVCSLILMIGLFLIACDNEPARTLTPTPTPAPTLAPAPATAPAPAPAPAKATKPLVAPTDASIPGPDPNGKFGGRLNLVGSGNIANFGNPNMISNPGDARYAFTAVESLMRLDAKGILQPWLAKSWTIADDGSSVTFFLREGVKFHDGTNLDAEAVKYNIDIQITTNLKAVESCQIIAPMTVKLNFKGGKFDWPAFNSLGSFFSCMIFSPKFLKENTDDYKRTHVVGTGPFKLAEFRRDEIVKFDRFDEYWRGKPFLDGIDYKIIPDTTTQLLAYKAGEIDVLGVQPKDVQDLRNSKFEVQELPPTTVFNLCLIPSSNNKDSPLANIKVRQAFEYAIDKKALVEALTYGYGHATNQVFIQSQAYFDPTTKGYPYDPAKAKALLKEAGYPDGFKTSFLLVDFLPIDLPRAIQEMVKQVGITMEINRVSILQINDMVAAGGTGWEGWFYTFVEAGSNVDPANSLINGPINYNTTWKSNNEPEELIELARLGTLELETSQRIKIYQDISRKMVDNYAQWLFLYYSTGLMSISPAIKGHTIGQGSQFPHAFTWRTD